MQKKALLVIFLLFFLASCNSINPQIETVQNSDTPESVLTSTFTATPRPTNTPEPRATPEPTSTPEPSPTPTQTEHPGWLPEGALQSWGNGTFYDMAASPDSRTLAVAMSGGIYLIDPASGRVQDFLELAYTPRSIVFSPDGNHMYFGLRLGGVQVWTIDGKGKWQVEKTIKDLCGQFIKVSPDGKTLLAKCFSKKDKSFKAWDLTTDKQIFNLNYQIKITNVFAMGFSPTDPTRAAFARGNILAIIDLKTGRDLKTFTVPETKIITDVDFSPDGKTIAVSPYTPEVILLDAETLEEKQRVAIPGEVQMLTFISDEKLVVLTNNTYVVQNIDGSDRHMQSSFGFPMHAYMPALNRLALASNAINIIDLNEFVYKYTINKFGPGVWNRQEFSSDGKAFIYGQHNSQGEWTYYKGTLDQPGETTTLDVKTYCPGRVGPDFADNEGNYYYVNCPDNKQLVVVDFLSMRTVTQLENPLQILTNTSNYWHPWKDEQELSALLYKSNKDDSNGYRVEIKDIIRDQDISTITLPSSIKEQPIISGFSPSSKYLVIQTSDKKEYQIYSTDDGTYVQTIKVTLENLDKYDNPGFDLIKDETMFLIRKRKRAELVSIETGETVKRYLALKSENFEYAESIDRLVNYTHRWVHQKKSAQISFDVYPLDSNKIEKTYTVDLHFAGETIDREQDPPYDCNMGAIHLIPAHDTLNAIVILDCTSNNHLWDYQSWNSFRRLIYKVNVLEQRIELMYKYYPDFSWFTHTYLFDDKFYTVDDSHIFSWNMAGD